MVFCLGVPLLYPEILGEFGEEFRENLFFQSQLPEVLIF